MKSSSLLPNPAQMDPLPLPGERLLPTAQDSTVDFANRFYTGGPLAGWQFEPRIPALVRSVAHDASASNGRQTSARNVVDWIVIALDRNDVQNNILPALAQRYFRGTEGLDYQIAVTTGRDSGQPLYSSDAGFGNAEIADADGTMNIFGRLRGNGQGSPIHIFHTPSQENGPAASAAVTWFPLLHGVGADQDWRLIVQASPGRSPREPSLRIRAAAIWRSALACSSCW